MEQLHWARHRCRQLLAADVGRGWYSSPGGDNPLPAKGPLEGQRGQRGQRGGGGSSPQRFGAKRRTVVARHGPYRAEYHSIVKGCQGNSIRTTKYSLLSFIPMNLFQQFHRAANLYFLFLVLLNWVPVVEAFQKEITMIPLAVVLGVIAIKDALEDYRRYLFDKKVNNNVACVYSGEQKSYVAKRWQDVRVGDFVRLSCNEIIPADMLLLYSSDPHGVCYIETANLDGETNLKQRQVVTDLPQGTEVTPESFHSHVECENPNDDLSRFKGYMEHPNKVRVGLHINNLLLRSCTVRNTETVVGMVVYAGHETKAMKNNSGPRYKRSQLERRLNVDVLWCVVLLFLMCFVGAVGHGLWLKQWKDPIFLDGDEPPPALAGFYVFWTMIIVLQVLIPISLYVSIEIVKLGQIYFIQNDLDLYNEPLDCRIQCRALNITEDLGQVQYVFSDKTGTLTENKMVFRRCTIYGVEYPHLDNARRLEVYEAEESETHGRSPTLRSGCSVKSLSCRSLSCNRSSVSLHTLTNEDEADGEHGDASDPAHQPPPGAFCSRMAKEVVPDPLLVRKLNCLSSPPPLLALSGGSSPWAAAPPTSSVAPPPTSVAPPSLELTYIVDFFMALAICNSVVVSSPSQPRHVVQVPEYRTPLKSLEDIKLMFGRFSLTHFSALSTTLSASSSSTTAALQANESPHSFTRRLFTWGGGNKAGSFSPATAAAAATATPPIAAHTHREGPESESDPGPEPPGELEEASILGSMKSSAQVERRSDGDGEDEEEEGWQTEDDSPAERVDVLSSNSGSAGGADNSAADDNAADDQLLYEAESPDEAALVHAARAYRCTLRARSAERLLVDLPGMGSLAVQLLHILPFDSTRKRMSVVVRHPLTGQVVVYTKGADSVIMELAEAPAPPQGREQAAETYAHIREQTQKHLDGYAREGLRTLCIAKKVMEEEEYEVWLKRHVFAETSIENREELLMESAQNLETNLTLLGATGIVDRLQEEVPETIESLQKAGVKVWVLTGDKQETAVNIACACKLLQPSDQLLTANCGSKDACAALLQELIVEVERGRLNSLTAAREEEEGAEPGGGGRRTHGDAAASAARPVAVAAATADAGPGFTLVMDGRTLNWALQEDLKEAFLELSQRCKAVICCRSTPLQKSQVVRLVRDHLKVMTLAIGDGANDVSMIQVADVGIGISGQEGMQAVMSSDFAISRFKHLRKLLLVHGHWCYARLANMILYFFYKNVMYVNLLFWYQFFCGFSGSVMINAWVLILFNLLFTSVPPLVYGVLDRGVAAGTLMTRPGLYGAGSTHKVYVPSTFWLTILDAFYQSLVCFFVPYCAYAGSDVGVLAFGSPINTSALFIILLHQVIESRTLTWIHMSVLLGSGGLYFVFVVVFSVCCVSCSPPTNPLGVETLQMTQPLFYLVCVLTTVIALLPRVVFRSVYNSVCPSSVTRAFLRERTDPAGTYARRMQRWNQAHSRAHRRRSSRLPVHEDPRQIEASAGAGSVLS